VDFLFTLRGEKELAIGLPVCLAVLKIYGFEATADRVGGLISSKDALAGSGDGFLAWREERSEYP